MVNNSMAGYQQTNQPFSHLKQLNTKKNMTYHMMLEMHVLAWDRHNNGAGLNLLNNLVIIMI